MLSSSHLPLMFSSKVPFPCVPTTVVFLLPRLVLSISISVMREKKNAVDDNISGPLIK